MMGADLVSKCPFAGVFVDRLPFAWGGMRLVYNMEDTYNVDKRKQPIKMVAKRLIRKEHATLKEMLPFCYSTEKAIMFRASFLKALRKVGLDALIFFVPCYLYSYGQSEKSYFVAEQLLEETSLNTRGLVRLCCCFRCRAEKSAMDGPTLII